LRNSLLEHFPPVVIDLTDVVVVAGVLGDLVFPRGQCGHGHSLHLLLDKVVGLPLVLMVLGDGATGNPRLCLLPGWLFVRKLELSFDMACVELWTFEHLQIVNWDIRIGFSGQARRAAVLDDLLHAILPNIFLVMASKTSRSMPHLKWINACLRRESHLSGYKLPMLDSEVLLVRHWVQRNIMARSWRRNVHFDLSLCLQDFFDCQFYWILNVVFELIQSKSSGLVVLLAGRLNDRLQRFLLLMSPR